MTALLGIDPGFAAPCLARVELVGAGERVAELGVVRRAKSDRKRRVRASDGNVRRVLILVLLAPRMRTSIKLEGRDADLVKPGDLHHRRDR